MIHRISLVLFFSHFLHIFAHAAAPPAPVPQTGQTTCYQGIVAVACAGTGQDGDALAGVAWPVPRFEDNGDQTIADKLTGLSWTKDADSAKGYKTWQQALEYVRSLNDRKHLGHDDWRLPNVDELESLINKQANLVMWLQIQGFTNVREDYYWTSSTYASCTTYAWCVGTYSGIVAGRSKRDVSYAWPVREERPRAGLLSRTGQTTCHDDSGMAVACPGTGHDGELQAGVAWPSPRFAAADEQTTTDRLTGLVWTKDGNTPGPSACSSGAPRTWHGALDHVGCLNANHFLGRSDWRLPNHNELTSLLNREEPSTAAWLNAEGFSNIQPSSYWSSGTYPYNVWNAWSVNLHDGAVTSMAKRHEIHVWPVRDR